MSSYKSTTAGISSHCSYAISSCSSSCPYEGSDEIIDEGSEESFSSSTHQGAGEGFRETTIQSAAPVIIVTHPHAFTESLRYVWMESVLVSVTRRGKMWSCSLSN